MRRFWRRSIRRVERALESMTWVDGVWFVLAALITLGLIAVLSQLG